MYTGKTLTELATELERQKATKKDYLADTAAIRVEPSGGDVQLVGLPSAMPLTSHAHGQLSAYTGIPKKYYDRMRTEEPELLSRNVNTWLHKSAEPRMLRTLDGKVRAMMSPKYRALDYYDLTEVALPEMIQAGAEVISCDVTETRLYLKAIVKSVSAEIKGSRQVGDIVQAGIVLSNSEVGAGAVRVEPMIYRLRCLNGMIAPDASLKKYHVGRAFDLEENVRELLSEETQRLDDSAFWHKVRDIVRASFNRDVFAALVDKMSAAAGERIEGDLPKVVEATASRFGLSQETGASILKNLVEGGDVSRWGLINAITATANDAPDYETATELEHVGGQVLELPRFQWIELGNAA